MKDASPSSSSDEDGHISSDSQGEGYSSSGQNEVYVPSGKNIINDSPWPPDFEPTVKEMRRKLYEFGGKRDGFDEPPREEMRKLRQYYAVKFRSWLKDGNRDMSQLLCHYYAVAKMSNRCWERAVSIMEKYRLGLLKDMTKGLPVKQSIFQFVDRGNEEYTFDIMCKVERGETSLQEAKQKYRMILDKRKAKINTAKRLSTIEALTQGDNEIEKARRLSVEYDSRVNTVNGLSPTSYQQVDSRDEYRDFTQRAMDPRPMDPGVPISPNQPPVIKQEILPESSPPQEGGRDHHIRALNGIISAKEYEVTHFKDYNVHLQKVGSEREYEIEKLKKKLRDIENERDGMEKKWLDQVQSHVKEKYLIADLQKEVLLWKGKFKNLLDRIQGLECDARRDFDYSCRRSSMGDVPSSEYLHVSNSLSTKELEQRSHSNRGHESQEKVHKEGASENTVVHVPSTCAVPVLTRDRNVVPRMYRPEATYMYGYPSPAIHHASLVQNGIPHMKMMTSAVAYYDGRREAVAIETDDVERARGDVAVVTDEASLHEMDRSEKEVDVEGKIEERIIEEVEESDEIHKRLVIGNKAKIIVRKRSDVSRFLPPTQAKRKRIR